MKAVKDEITSLLDEAEELSDVEKDVFNKKTDLNIKAIGVLLETLKESTDSLSEITANKDYYDKELSKSLNDTVSQLVSAFSKIKSPTVTVNPNILVDLSSINSIASDISSQNKSLISLINKMGTGSNSDELHRLVVLMINKQNAFLETVFKQNDYTIQFNKLIEAIRDSRPVLEEIKVIKGQYGGQYTMTPVYKTTAK